jgi:ABC-2 type transport system permease protein
MVSFKDKMRLFWKNFLQSLKRIGNQVQISIKLFIRSPLTVFSLIITPVILLLLFGAIFATGRQYEYQLEVQDHDHTVLSESLIQELMKNDLLTIHRLDNNIEPKAYLQQNGLHSCLVIPDGWTVDSFDPEISMANVTLITNPQSERAMIVKEIVSKTINDFNMNYTGQAPLISIEKTSFTSRTINYFDFFLPGILGIIIMNVGMIGTILRQSYFRRLEIYRKLAFTPVTRGEYFLSEIIWQFIIVFFSILLALFTAWLAFGFSWGSLRTIMVIITLIGVVMFSGLGLVIFQLLDNSRLALAIGMLIVIPMLFLSGVFFDFSGITALEILSRFSPLTFVVEAFRATMITKNFALAWLNTGIAFGISIICYLLGIFLTKWKKE